MSVCFNDDIQVYDDLLLEKDNDFIDRIINNKNVIEDNISSDSTYSNQINISIEKFINIPVFREEPYKKPACFQVIQEWEGYIQEIDKKNKKFTAILLDITAKEKYPKEEADFNLDDVNDFDKHFLQKGAVFRWVIGYYQSPAGSKKRSSELVFRRMPRFNAFSLKQADKKAKEFKDEITWE